MASARKVAVYCGCPPENTTERRLLAQLVRELTRLDIEAVVLANFYVGISSTQIDVVISTSTVACVTEVKGFRHPVEGGLNGPWVQRLSETESRSLGWKNPYIQALEARFAVVDALAAFCGAPSEQLRSVVKGFACLYPAPMHGSKIPKSNYKVALGGFDDLLRLCRTAVPNAVSLEAWQNFARHLGLVDIAQHEDAGRKETQVAKSYASALASIYTTHTVAFIDPPVSELESGSETLSALGDKLARGEQLLIVGASGTGKTLLLERLLLRACDGAVPILLEARNFEGNIGAALRNAVSLATSVPLSALLRSVRLADYPLIVLVDGLNECDNPIVNRLLRALVARLLSSLSPRGSWLASPGVVYERVF